MPQLAFLCNKLALGTTESLLRINRLYIYTPVKQDAFVLNHSLASSASCLGLDPRDGIILAPSNSYKKQAGPVRYKMAAILCPIE